MRYQILYQPAFSMAVVSLQRGEQIMAESGAMVSMSPSIRLKAAMSGGGLLGAVKSAMGGESMFRTTFTAEEGPGDVAFAPAALGDIMGLEVDTGHIVAFEDSVDYQVEKATGKSQGVGGFLKGMMQSALSGEMLVCRYRGPGTIYLQTRQLPGFARQLTPFLPKPSSGG